MAEPGRLCFVLHAHLPYVRHPECERCLEEVWFFEALTECYLPLLGVFERLAADGLGVGVGWSVSPVLLHLLGDGLMRARYEAHMERLIELAQREQVRLRGEPEEALAAHYEAHFRETLRRYREVYKGDVLGALQALEEAGVIELMTTSATHAYLPLFAHQPGAVRAQVLAGAKYFEGCLGKAAKGFWLPECGYVEGVEGVLKEAGVGYTFVDTHGLGGRSPYAPVRTPEGLVVFARDPEASRQVWSAREGYPGDPWYREYYSDVGLTLPPEELGDYALPGGVGLPSGIKYQRVSARGEPKELYEPARALERVREHARHFVRTRLQRLEAGPQDKRPMVMLAPYDAELFGHWWYEGPAWLEATLREVARSKRLDACTPGEVVACFEEDFETARPVASSWGQGGHNDYWLNDQTAWVYPQLHEAYERLRTLIKEGRVPERLLKQAARSLWLAQASDWPFIMRAGTASDYAVRRIKDALARFRYLEDACRGAVDEQRLQALEHLDAVFPEIELAWFLPERQHEVSTQIVL